MKRYYVSPVVERNVPGLGLERYLKVRDYAPSHIAAIADGQPLGFALVATPNHAVLIADTELNVLPDLPLDIRLSAMATAARAQLDAALVRVGLDPASFASSAAYRATVDAIGQTFDGNFSANNFDISDS